MNESQGQTVTDSASKMRGPDEAKLKDLLKRTGYNHKVTIAKRVYGPPPDVKEAPKHRQEIFVGGLPEDVFEDELVPLFEKHGKIYDLELFTHLKGDNNRGFASVRYCERGSLYKAATELDGLEIRPGVRILVEILIPQHHRFCVPVPASKSREEILEEFRKVSKGLVDVIVDPHPDDPTLRNQGFAFLMYDSHITAAIARLRLDTVAKVFDDCQCEGKRVDPENGLENDVTKKVKNQGFACLKHDSHIDAAIARLRFDAGTKVSGNFRCKDKGADPENVVDDNVKQKVKGLHVSNLPSYVTEEQLLTHFAAPLGEDGVDKICAVKKFEFTALVDFNRRQDALAVMKAVNGTKLGHQRIEVSLKRAIVKTENIGRQSQGGRSISSGRQNMSVGQRIYGEQDMNSSYGNFLGVGSKDMSGVGGNIFGQGLFADIGSNPIQGLSADIGRYPKQGLCTGGRDYLSLSDSSRNYSGDRVTARVENDDRKGIRILQNVGNVEEPQNSFGSWQDNATGPGGMDTYARYGWSGLGGSPTRTGVSADGNRSSTLNCDSRREGVLGGGRYGAREYPGGSSKIHCGRDNQRQQRWEGGHGLCDRDDSGSADDLAPALADLNLNTILQQGKDAADSEVGYPGIGRSI